MTQNKAPVRSPATRSKGKDCCPGSIIGTVNPVAHNRRKQVLKAASYLCPPTPESVDHWFKIYSPVDQRPEVFDHFLKLVIIGGATGQPELGQWLVKLKKDADARQAAKAQ